MANAAPPPPPPPVEGIPIGEDANNNAALRFEDLTIDDDLPLLDRVVRYCRSGIALQRLVHVKMLAETASSVGTNATLRTLVPLLPPLVADPESIIRQHLATQLLPMALTCMYVDEKQNYNERGYQVVMSHIVQTSLSTLVQDPDPDVRRAASESLSSLASHVKSEDVAPILLPIPLRMAQISPDPKKNSPFTEDLKITAANLLGELGATLGKDVVSQFAAPAILKFAQDDVSFRVRRAAVQALPRILGGCTPDEAKDLILPAFSKLAQDDMYRVRKAAGECLVDMSRSLMLVAHNAVPDNNEEVKREMRKMRRTKLIPICQALLTDANKFVRHGMMQFLGPFVASFYPLNKHHQNNNTGENDIAIMMGDSSPVKNSKTINLKESTLAGSGGNGSGGIGAQFFPHASSMVSRLNSSFAANTSATPTPVAAGGFGPPANQPKRSEYETLIYSLPDFILSQRRAMTSLHAVLQHRDSRPPDPADLEAIQKHLLHHFCSLARISTGDEGSDAEMRVYCAYSFPAIVLLLGREHWSGPLHNCFLALVNPSTTEADTTAQLPPPLPVKRCLASSLHTVAHILGPKITETDLLPVFVQHFFRDNDESVRLNVIRHFPSLLSLLESPRSKYLELWAQVVKAEDLLGAHKRSVTNPSLLNWRQRDGVARSLPHLLLLTEPQHIRTILWPILKMLLQDGVSLVRENAEWSIPILLLSYGNENFPEGEEACQEVVQWLRSTILVGGSNFAKRQLYCRICASVALALRLGSQSVSSSSVYGPYQTLPPAKYEFLSNILVEEMLPPALEMKDDRVTNVRLTLIQVLRVMPLGVQKLTHVQTVMNELEDEAGTWESMHYGNANNSTTNNSIVPKQLVESSPGGKKDGNMVELKKSNRKKNQDPDDDLTSLASI